MEQQTGINRYDWTQVSTDLDSHGHAVLPGVLDALTCADTTALFADEDRFRAHIIMARHGFGRGEYLYFRYPLPDLILQLRTALYPRLATIANRWQQMLGRPPSYPTNHADFLAQCHHAGQTRPTPLLLRYGPGDYNCLHQDLYGDLYFPLQVAILLTHPGQDFTGGEFVLTEQRPRRQSRVEVVPLSCGDAVIFPVNERPAVGRNGTTRVTMRHGVSRIHSGHRQTLGLIFHDAR